MSKKKGIKKEHLLIGAGALALIYLLSKGTEGRGVGFGAGGLGDVPGLETITTETITTPSGGEEIGGSILLPPPTPGRFFDVPDWVKPNGGERAGGVPGEVPPPKKVKLTTSDISTIGEMGREYRKEIGISPTAPLPISDAYAPGEITIGGAEWQATLAKSKKEKLTSQLLTGAKMGVMDSIPGQFFSTIRGWF